MSSPVEVETERLKNARTAALLRSAPPKRILIRGREYIGDLANSTAALAAIRRRFPDSHIVVEAGQPACEILEACDSFDELWPRPLNQGALGKLRMIRRMRRGRFDAVFVLEVSRVLILESFLAGIPIRIGLHKGKSLRFYSGMVRGRRDVHEVRGNLEALLEAVGIPATDLGPSLSVSGFLPRALEVLAETGWDPGLPSVGVTCAAPHTRRQWPPDNVRAFAAIAGHLGIQCVLTGGPEDAPHWPDIPGCIDLIGKLSLPELAAAASLMDVYVATDTGPMHIAAAVGVPVVALYEAHKDPVFTGPAGDRNVILLGDLIDRISAGEVAEAVSTVLWDQQG